MKHLKFSIDGQEVGVVSVFGGRVVSASGDTAGIVIGMPESELAAPIQAAVDMQVAVEDDSESMMEQALFGLWGHK